MDFGQALKLMKAGYKLTRPGWNGKDMWVVLMPGYPEGVTADLKIEEVTGIMAGSVVVYQPFFLLKTADGSLAHWTPSGSDILADDWQMNVNQPKPWVSAEAIFKELDDRPREKSIEQLSFATDARRRGDLHAAVHHLESAMWQLVKKEK
jgi:hypothetical protein